MRKKLFFHIGSHKTGTTALQNFLFKNKGFLNENAVLYPKFGGTEVFAHHFLARPIVKEKIEDFIWTMPGVEHIKTEADIKEALASEMKEHAHCDVVIMSSEFFFINRGFFENIINYDSPASYLEKLFPDYEIYPVIYLRNQVDFVESCYVEAVKGAHTCYTKSFDRYLNENKESLDYSAFISDWQEVFGDNLIVRCYEETLDRGIEADFLELIEIDASISSKMQKVKAEDSNPSLNASGVELVRVFNQLNAGMPDKNKYTFPFSIEEMVREEMVGKPFFLDYSASQGLLESFSDSNNKLSERYKLNLMPVWRSFLSRRIDKHINNVDLQSIWQLLYKKTFALQASLFYFKDVEKQKDELYAIAEERLHEIARVGAERDELYAIAEERLREIARVGAERDELYAIAEERLHEIHFLKTQLDSFKKNPLLFLIRKLICRSM